MNDILKIGHVPFIGMMYDTFNLHMINMSNLESMYGMNSIVLPSVSYYDQNNIPEDFNLLHIHGFPNIRNSASFLSFLKNMYINDQKFILSLHNYSSFCTRAIFRNENGEQCKSECANEECLVIRKCFDFLKDINIFVYSNNLYNYMKSIGYNKIYLVPICYEWKSFNFEFSEITFSNCCGYFKYEDNLFDIENKFIDNFVNEHKDLKFVSVGMSSNFDFNKCIFPDTWKCSFPYEIGLCLSKGIVPLVNILSGIDDFNDIQNYKSVDDLQKLILDTLCDSKIIAFDFWKTNGPHQCISSYDSFYRYILDN